MGANFVIWIEIPIVKLPLLEAVMLYKYMYITQGAVRIEL